MREYGRQPELGYRLHGGTVQVGFDGGRVTGIWFSTGYYRTKSGFGVGSRIPIGPCHRTTTNHCEHHWHGFVWNEWVREKPCNCWTKVGPRAQSLPVSFRNFLKPWFFIDVRHGRVSSFYFASRFVDSRDWICKGGRRGWNADSGEEIGERLSYGVGILLAVGAPPKTARLDERMVCDSGIRAGWRFIRWTVAAPP